MASPLSRFRGLWIQWARDNLFLIMRGMEMIFKVSFLIAILMITPFHGNITNASDSSKDLDKLFMEYWQWKLREFPESATLIGDHRYNDKLTDLSFEAIEHRKDYEREMLKR